jgi:hypothetical protein
MFNMDSAERLRRMVKTEERAVITSSADFLTELRGLMAACGNSNNKGEQSVPWITERKRSGETVSIRFSAIYGRGGAISSGIIESTNGTGKFTFQVRGDEVLTDKKLAEAQGLFDVADRLYRRRRVFFGHRPLPRSQHAAV